MKKSVLFIFAIIIALAFPRITVQAQRNCGTGIKLQELAAEHPETFMQLRRQQQQRTAEALSLAQSTAQKTTAQHPIPVVFHFILTPTQWNQIGNDTGIRRRVNSQIQSLNADFNRKNADSSLIPAAFKSLYGNANIQFGLAGSSNANTISPGIEVKVLPASSNPVYDANVDCYTAKQASAVGLASWDVTKYLNIWVVNITAGGAGIVVGVTTPPSSVGILVGPLPQHQITAAEMGVVLNYGAVGVREFTAQYFISHIDKGRTLTHEIGHFFELWHTWGDDAGACTVHSGGEDDDYIADTPPEGDAHYCNGGICPSFPTTDNCSPNSPGVMYMNYMNYVDDRAMQMFTPLQAQFMQAVLVQQSYSLTQNPHLLSIGTPRVSENAFRVYPNPAKDAIHIAISGKEKLLGIDVVNMLGQSISHTAATHAGMYDISLAGAARGIYFVRCRFAEGTLTKKIVLE